MGTGSFRGVATVAGSLKWTQSTEREDKIYQRGDDIRSPFARDYNRILHSQAYRRLKHKTQVFFTPQNDHLCTRIEHVNHVQSISYTMANYFGLNSELTNAIAIGHDLGHAPFGHAGENAIKKIATKELNAQFWHEKNSLYFVDNIETLEGPDGNQHNLNLTYAVRDGLICHCGEVDDSFVTPRSEAIDLNKISEPAEHDPFTWEGCIVKLSDKIAYLGRDIEDALLTKILERSQIDELWDILKSYDNKIQKINNTVIIHKLIIDACENSSPEKGISFSQGCAKFIKALKEFNYKEIYKHERLSTYIEYINFIIESIYKELKSLYNKEKTVESIDILESTHPNLNKRFVGWLKKYSKLDDAPKDENKKIRKLYDLTNENDYIRAIIDFIAGMSDNFALKMFEEIISF